MYFDQLLLAARKVHVVYLDQLLGAAHYIHFISNHDNMRLEIFRKSSKCFWFVSFYYILSALISFKDYWLQFYNLQISTRNLKRSVGLLFAYLVLQGWEEYFRLRTVHWYWSKVNSSTPELWILDLKNEINKKVQVALF